jgi:hypothetical protein
LIYLLVFLQFFSISILTLGWGKILFATFGQRNLTEELIPNITLNFILGSVFLAFIGYTTSKFVPSIFPYLGSVLFVPAIFISAKNIPSTISCLKNLPLHKWIIFIFLLSLSFIFLLKLATVPYPGALTQGMGDIPSYYRVSQNLFEGRGLMNDVTILDYPGGQYFTPTTHGLASILGAIFYGVFGINHFSIDLYTLFASILSLAMATECIRKIYPTSSNNEYFLFPMLVIAPLLLFDSIPLFAVSHISFLSLLGILSLLYLQTFSEISLPKKAFLIAAHIFFLVFSHPIGIFFLIGMAIFYLFLLSKKSKLVSISVLVTLFFAISFLIFYRRSLIEGNFTILSYVKYNEHKGFYYLFKPWSMLNINYIRYSLGLDSEIGNRNFQIFHEILEHPLDFIYFLFFWIKRQLWTLYETALILVVVCAIQIYRKRVSPIYMIVPFFYFLLHRILSGNMNLRHYYPSLVLLWIPMGALILEWASMIRRSFGSSITKISSAVLFCVSAFLLIFFLDQDLSLMKVEQSMIENRGYLVGLEKLRGELKKGDLVASDYPQLTAFLLNTPSAGASNLGAKEDELSLFLEKYQPTYWYFSDFFRREIYQKPIYRESELFGKYQKIFESPSDRLIIYRKIPEKN